MNNIELNNSKIGPCRRDLLEVQFKHLLLFLTPKVFGRARVAK